MAEIFPTLTGSSKSPRPIEYIDTPAYDPTIRSPKEAGFAQTRSRYSRIPRNYRVVFNGITESDKNLIRDHEIDRGIGGATFTWTPPDRATTLTVRFAIPVIYTPFEETNYKFWNVEMELEEV
jgi:hypothetical protein